MTMDLLAIGNSIILGNLSIALFSTSAVGSVDEDRESVDPETTVRV